MMSVLAVSLIGQSCVAQQVTYAPIQYAQNYNQSYVEKTVFVAVEDAQTYYAGLVGSQQRQAERQAQAQQIQSSTDAKLDRLAAIVEALQKKLENQPNGPLLPEKPVPANAPQPVPSEAVPPPPTISQAASRASHPGLAILTKHCAGCHQGSATKGGGVVLFASNGQFRTDDSVSLESIESAISSGRMPKRAAKPMTLKEYVAIRDYLNEQAGGLALNTNPRKPIR